MKIAYLDFIYDESDCLEEITDEMRKCANEGTVLDYICMEKVSSLDYMAYETIILPELIKAVGEISEKGYDAVIIGCCLDPGINTLREIYKDIVIVGPFESATAIAKVLGRKFSIIATRSKAKEQYLETIYRSGCRDALASIRFLGLKVTDIHVNQERLHNKMILEIEKAIEEDFADVIVLACTMETGQYAQLQKKLNIPVIDPTVAALKYAEMMVSVKETCGWSVSSVGTYETPPKDELYKFIKKDMKIKW